MRYLYAFVCADSVCTGCKNTDTVHVLRYIISYGLKPFIGIVEILGCKYCPKVPSGGHMEKRLFGIAPLGWCSQVIHG